MTDRTLARPGAALISELHNHGSREVSVAVANSGIVANDVVVKDGATYRLPVPGDFDEAPIMASAAIALDKPDARRRFVRIERLAQIKDVKINWPADAALKAALIAGLAAKTIIVRA